MECLLVPKKSQRKFFREEADSKDSDTEIFYLKKLNKPKDKHRKCKLLCKLTRSAFEARIFSFNFKNSVF